LVLIFNLPLILLPYFALEFACAGVNGSGNHTLNN
jgi:hypothetical protein